MRFPIRLGYIVAACALLSLSASCLAQESSPRPRPYQIDDLYLADGFSSPVVSPDGSRAVCVRSWIDEETKQEHQALWLTRGEAASAAPFEPGQPDARDPIFSPDGKWIVFPSQHWTSG